ncbi:MAG: hypothetical protein ACI89U_002355 [Gammaproteobacteria bacterium]|jgi:hypothetical protein
MITETQLSDAANRVDEPIDDLTPSKFLLYSCCVQAFLSIVEFHLSAIERVTKEGSMELLK